MRHKHYFRVVGGIVVHDDRRPNLVGRVLPNVGRKYIARINVRYIPLCTYRVAEAATDIKRTEEQAAGDEFSDLETES